LLFNLINSVFLKIALNQKSKLNIFKITKVQQAQMA